MDEILKELDWEKRADRTVLYKLDGKPAFIDRVTGWKWSTVPAMTIAAFWPHLLWPPNFMGAS
ncbi:hypothetical protein CEQ27_29100 (plasmid) [Escherichia coli O104:H4]|nr:hypothetical protein CEQ27_29100 [Escherichia coli O104:H4]